MKNDIQEAEELANYYRDMWQSLLFVIIFTIPILAALFMTL